MVAARRAGRRAAGFTLIELLVTLSVVGVLTSVALPSFRELTANRRLKDVSSDIYTSMVRARSEAIKRNTPVTLAPIDANLWSSGWRIMNPTQAGVVLEQHDALKSATVTAPGMVTYLANGRISGSNAPSFNIVVDGSTNVRCVTADLSGRPRITKLAC
ncbi:MAG: GspH/FimT family pseudopilin [Pseudomonadota bacterium]